MWDIRKIIKKGDYLYAVVPEHPRATRNGYVLHHRVVAENELLGRLLRENEVVHHKNHDKHDNRPENLEVMLRGQHTIFHSKRPEWLIDLECDFCGEKFSRRNNQRGEIKGYKNKFCSRRCNGKFQRRAQVAERIRH